MTDELEDYRNREIAARERRLGIKTHAPLQVPEDDIPEIDELVAQLPDVEIQDESKVSPEHLWRNHLLTREETNRLLAFFGRELAVDKDDRFESMCQMVMEPLRGCEYVANSVRRRRCANLKRILKEYSGKRTDQLGRVVSEMCNRWPEPPKNWKNPFT